MVNQASYIISIVYMDCEWIGIYNNKGFVFYQGGIVDYTSIILLWFNSFQMKLSPKDMRDYKSYCKSINYVYPDDYMARKYIPDNKKKRFNRTPRKNGTWCGNKA